MWSDETAVGRGGASGEGGANVRGGLVSFHPLKRLIYQKEPEPSGKDLTSVFAITVWFCGESPCQPSADMATGLAGVSREHTVRPRYCMFS